MTDRSSIAVRLLLAAGIIEVVAGLLHFAIPHFAYQARAFSFLGQDESGLVTAAILSVGILLIAFGTLTIRLSAGSTPTETLLFYATIKSVLWSARAVIEVLYPVTVPLFLVGRPTVLLLPAFALELLLFALAAILLFTRSSDHGPARARTSDPGEAPRR